MAADTIFRLYSMTKPIVCVALIYYIAKDWDRVAQRLHGKPVPAPTPQRRLRR
jgi:hypothetical protein